MRSFLPRALLRLASVQAGLLGLVLVLTVGVVHADTYTIAGRNVTKSPPSGLTPNATFGNGHWSAERSNDDVAGVTGIGQLSLYQVASVNTGYVLPSQSQTFNYHVRVYWVPDASPSTKYYVDWYSAKDATVAVPAHIGPQFPTAENNGSYSGGVNPGTGTGGDSGLIDASGNINDSYGNGTPPANFTANQSITNSSDQAQSYLVHIVHPNGTSDDVNFVLQPGQTTALNLSSATQDTYEVSHLPSMSIEGGAAVTPFLDASGTMQGAVGTAAAGGPSVIEGAPSTAPAATVAQPAQTATGTASTGASQNDIKNLSTDMRNALGSLQSQDKAAGDQAHKDANGIAGALQGAGSGSGSSDPTASGSMGAGPFAAVGAIPAKVGTVVSDLNNIGNLTPPNSGGGSSSWNFNVSLFGYSGTCNLDSLLAGVSWIRTILLIYAFYIFVQQIVSSTRRAFAQ